MQITLSDGQVLEILAIDFAKGQVDWQRTEGYTGACVSYVTISGFMTAEAEITAALEAELVQA